MNKKGFTLIELLATITLLAIIVAIAVPAVNTAITKSKKNNCEKLEKSIIRAAESYVSDNKYNLTWNNHITTVTLNDLYSTNLSSKEQYLNTKINNPCNNRQYTENEIILKFKEQNGNISCIGCEGILENIFECCK